MILLTRLNQTRLAVNSDLIKYVEEAPDTVITLVNGEKLVVLESAQEVIQRVKEFRSSILAVNGTSPPSHGGSQTERRPGEAQDAS